jgi:regulator of sirC expression with transglutaminase-like and TPR domain
MVRTTPFADSPEFRRLLAGDSLADLTRIALEVARDAYPDLDADACLARIDALAERVRDRCREGARVKSILGQINWVLFEEERFRGNDEEYYDPRNSYLNVVLERKLGIPLSLSILYRAVAERIGLELSGVNLPAHFLLRAGRGGQTVFIDPYHAGRLLDREGCARRVQEVTGQAVALTDAQLAPCAVRVVVIRMLRNLKAVYLKDDDFAAAVPVLRRLVALGEGDPLERRDLGVALLHAARAGEAIDHLQAYLSTAPLADDAGPVAALLRAARREVAAWN